MEKYKKGIHEKAKPTIMPDGRKVIEPFKDAQRALARAAFAEKIKEEFFQDAYEDILLSLFEQWLKTEPHAQKEREYLYHCALALGSVKAQLIQFETYGANAQYFKKNQEGSQEDTE